VKGKSVLSECCEVLKRKTSRYAKVQLNWIRNHMLPWLTIHRVDSSGIKASFW
jgi:tRNA A37 N6-isopentenylltransferase MiaA